ncbi:hypothetical protein [Paracoccus methylarcula]|uniref:Uncharacterized protein n=1 Tax=Paracoccus methylarcula TaxID=72022 RepID=A0A422QZR8_9RHOB|nr:hypothetical protein [Paracoccus methylarcula]RNF35485.1 hypothetical protein A7A09_003360 [Paracoccus methylarcula]
MEEELKMREIGRINCEDIDHNPYMVVKLREAVSLTPMGGRRQQMDGGYEYRLSNGSPATPVGPGDKCFKVAGSGTIIQRKG